MAKRTIPALLAISALVLVALIGAITYRSASAQSSTPTTEAPANSKPVQGGRLAGGRHGGYTQEQLAATLGVEVDTLQAAIDTANQAALEQAVSQGMITQEQADAYLANGQEGRQAGKIHGLSAAGIDYDALLAKALGISVENLQAAKQQAFNTAIDEAVSNGTLTQDQANMLKGQNALYNSEKFQMSIRSAFETAVNQAVTDGTITQAQADQILSSQQSAPGFDGRGFGRRGGRHGEFPPASPDSPSGETPSPETGGDL